MLNKFLKIMMLALASVTLALVLSACNNPGAHEHEWDNGITVKSATCSETGVKTYTCKGCRATYDEALPLIDHTYSTEWTYDDAEHWREAICGHQSRGFKGEHQFSAQYFSDDYYHWKICVTCGSVGEKNLHEPDENGLCQFCRHEVELTEGLQYTLSLDGEYYVLEGRGTALLTKAVIKSHVDGKPVREIGASAFENATTLEGVVIPDTVVKIGNNAFKGCNKLASVSVPSSVTFIGMGAFDGCEALKTNDTGNLKYLGNSSFDYVAIIGATDEEITSCDIQSGVSVVAYGAFEGLSSLQKIKINDLPSWCGVSVTDANSGPFGTGATVNYLNKELTSLALPDSVKYIGRNAFALSGVTTVDLGKVEKVGEYAFMGSAVTSVIGNKTASVERMAFAECESLTTVSLPELTELNHGAFEGCGKLESVTIGAVKEISARAFSNCGSLKSFVLSEATEKIGEYAFYANELTSIDLGSVKEIGNNAFASSAALLHVNLPSTLTTIGESAFRHSSSLKSLIIPASVTTVSNGLTRGCSALTVFMEAKSVPSGFADGWNDGGCEVVFGGDWEVVNGIPEKINKIIDVELQC